MHKIDEVREFLKDIKMPKSQQSDLCCLTILALAGIRPQDRWKFATNNWVRIHDIIIFVNNYYEVKYAENSRETIRKQALHYYRMAAVVEDNGMATNSPNYMYRLTEETLKILQSLSLASYQSKMEMYLAYQNNLITKYIENKNKTLIPVKFNGLDLKLSTGKHNELQKAVLEQFWPRFAKNAICLYVGDTVEKDLHINSSKLKEIGFEITMHDKMPDIVLYDSQKDWIYFVEAVTSVGPMNMKRLIEIGELTKNVKSGKIYITAFLDFSTYKRFSESLAWDTEVWIAEMPEHMIHLNGDRFLGPR